MKRCGVGLECVLVGVLAITGCDGRVQTGGVAPPPTPDAAGSSTFEFPDAGAVDDTPDAGFDPDPVHTAAQAPPAISGGTLLILRDGHTAVASDPDRDHVFVVDIAMRKVRFDVALLPGDEPGRIAQGANNDVYVALRSGRAVVTIDAVTGVITQRRAVCSAPRGVAFDLATSTLHVACLGGELVSIPTGNMPKTTLQLGRDLRDVIVSGSKLLVSRFRKAELIVIEKGVVTQTLTPPVFNNPAVRDAANFEPAVAWRTISLGNGSVAMLHQRGLGVGMGQVQTQQGGYGAPPPMPGHCESSIVHPTVTTLTPGQNPTGSAMLRSAVLAIDFALSLDQKTYAIVAAGNTPSGPRVFTMPVTEFTNPKGCVQVAYPVVPPQNLPPLGQPTSIAYATDDLVVQTREPSALYLSGAQVYIALSAVSREDFGHTLFHRDSGGTIACASCHPEGGEDGRVWPFDNGARRTQSLRGGFLGTEPFHWNGDMVDFPVLVNEVFVKRMSGPKLSPTQIGALSQWVDSIPVPATSPVDDQKAVDHGRTLFNDPLVACATCHSDVKYTSKMIVDVGTGAAFHVPSLRAVGWRSPYLHNGCAKTLRDRFGACGGGDRHGHTSQLSSYDIDDLIAFLNTI